MRRIELYDEYEIEVITLDYVRNRREHVPMSNDKEDYCNNQVRSFSTKSIHFDIDLVKRKTSSFTCGSA